MSSERAWERELVNAIGVQLFAHAKTSAYLLGPRTSERSISR
jgi:hypothetical protein